MGPRRAGLVLVAALVVGGCSRGGDASVSTEAPAASAEPPPPSAAPSVHAPPSASAVEAAPLAPVSASAAPRPAGPPRATWGPTEWTLSAQVHPSLAPHTFVVAGVVAPEPEPRGHPGARGWVSVGAGAAEIRVDDASGKRQRLQRRAYPEALGGFGSRGVGDLHVSFRAWKGPSANAGDVELVDLDSDGYQDLRVRIGLGAKAEFSQAWLFNPVNGLFEELVEFAFLSDPRPQASGCVASHAWTASSYDWSYFVIKQRKVVDLGWRSALYTEGRVERSGQSCEDWVRSQKKPAGPR